MSSVDLNSTRLTEYGLTQDEDKKCNKAFEAFDKDGSGYIDAEELKTVLSMMGQNLAEDAIYKMINQASSSQGSCSITLDEFKSVIGEQKKFQGATQEEETLDAFVSLGGEQDGTGHVDASRLINIIKNEFQMTIDIEKLISDIDEDGSGCIEYEEFMDLLSAAQDTTGN